LTNATRAHHHNDLARIIEISKAMRISLEAVIENDR
jgi:hypothetical protein